MRDDMAGIAWLNDFRNALDAIYDIAGARGAVLAEFDNLLNERHRLPQVQRFPDPDNPKYPRERHYRTILTLLESRERDLRDSIDRLARDPRLMAAEQEKESSNA